jgi:hypothetical protein
MHLACATQSRFPTALAGRRTHAIQLQAGAVEAHAFRETLIHAVPILTVRHSLQVRVLRATRLHATPLISATPFRSPTARVDHNTTAVLHRTDVVDPLACLVSLAGHVAILLTACHIQTDLALLAGHCFAMGTTAVHHYSLTAVAAVERAFPRRMERAVASPTAPPSLQERVLPASLWRATRRGTALLSRSPTALVGLRTRAIQRSIGAVAVRACHVTTTRAAPTRTALSSPQARVLRATLWRAILPTSATLFPSPTALVARRTRVTQ